jgi:hypothetical protein
MLRTSSRFLSTLPKFTASGSPVFLVKPPHFMSNAVRTVHSGQQAVVEQANRSRTRSLWLGAAAAAGVFAIGAIGCMCHWYCLDFAHEIMVTCCGMQH